MSRLDRFKEIGNSLISSNTNIASEQTIFALQAEIQQLKQGQPTTYLAAHLIRPSPFQPRKYFDKSTQAQLDANIKEFGVLQNLIVRRLDDGYELVVGERRLRASIANNLEVPVVIRVLTDRDARRLALAENLYRDNLNAIEETDAILHLLAVELSINTTEEVKKILYSLDNLAKGKKVTYKFVGSAEEIQSIVAQTIYTNANGMNWRSFIRNRLPLLNLPDEILTAIMSGQIDYTKAQSIARITDPVSRATILLAAIEQNWSLAEIKKQINIFRTQEVEKVHLEPKQRIQLTLNKAARSQIWQDPQRWGKIEKLLAKIDELLDS